MGSGWETPDPGLPKQEGEGGWAEVAGLREGVGRGARGPSGLGSEVAWVLCPLVKPPGEPQGPSWPGASCLDAEGGLNPELGCTACGPTGHYHGPALSGA